MIRRPEKSHMTNLAVTCLLPPMVYIRKDVKHLSYMFLTKHLKFSIVWELVGEMQQFHGSAD
jgi:hypothetical protein